MYIFPKGYPLITALIIAKQQEDEETAIDRIKKENLKIKRSLKTSVDFDMTQG